METERFEALIDAILAIILTIIVLIFFVGKSVSPSANGQPYEKGAR